MLHEIHVACMKFSKKSKLHLKDKFKRGNLQSINFARKQRIPHETTRFNCISVRANKRLSIC